MAKISGSYDTETGEFTVDVDGAQIPGVTNFVISAPAFYDNDEDDNGDSPYGPSITCNITTVEQAGELKKYSNYSNAGEKSVALKVNNIKIPGMFKQSNEVSRSIAEFFTR